jgi:hypothetical protein
MLRHPVATCNDTFFDDIEILFAQLIEANCPPPYIYIKKNSDSSPPVTVTSEPCVHEAPLNCENPKQV